MAFADELLDGHREMVAEFGASITMDGGNTPFGVVLVFPEASDDNESAGIQPRAMSGFEIERAFLTAAGITQDSFLYITGQSQKLHVTHVEDDPGLPIVMVSVEEAR